MKDLLIKNVRIVSPLKITEPTDLLIKDGKISKIGEINDESSYKTVYGKGNYLFPGFIELHVHGGGNADFMDATKEAFETAVKCHLEHGTTTIVPTAMSASFEDLCGFLNAYKEFKKTSAYGDSAVGVHLEGPYFSGANAKSSGAQPTDVLRYPDMDEVDKLLEIANGDIIRWDAAPEFPGALDFAKKMTENGILCAVGHSDATAEEAKKGFKSGFKHITHFYNATSMHRKREQKVFAGIVEATYLDDNITVELIGDGCHIAKEDFLLALKIKGAQNISVITDAMRLAGTDIKEGKLGGNKNGTPCIVDGGVAKLKDLSSFAGSVCTMERALKVLCGDFGFSPSIASTMMSYAPAKLLGLLKTKATAEIGKDADLCIVDKSFNLLTVIKDGEIYKD